MLPFCSFLSLFFCFRPFLLSCSIVLSILSVKVDKLFHRMASSGTCGARQTIGQNHILKILRTFDALFGGVKWQTKRSSHISSRLT
ncbi:hypothetical protein BDZ45DRAFT_289209 [Acephala macrosclerotiorum]|nr:hypothetical protein BDZ45DRAFT_289209 [Acephala macrosclerotiorum]